MKNVFIKKYANSVLEYLITNRWEYKFWQMNQKLG